MYDVFWTQNPLGFLEFSDKPIGHIPESDNYHGFFAAKHLTRYLEAYVDSHIYDNKTLMDRVRLGSEVKRITKSEGLWHVHVAGVEATVLAPKLIDASGLTSIPNMPDIPGRADFRGRTLHHKDFGQSDILTNASQMHLVVVGGAKSAADVVYAAAKAGKKVSWVIRKSGSGPAALTGIEGPGPYRNSNESLFTRFAGRLLGSIFAEEDWLSGLLYRTKLGRLLFRRLWKGINKRCSTLADYDREDGKENGFYNLKPDTELFWTNESPGTNQRPDFFDIIATKVQVYREDIDRYTQNGILLASQQALVADAIVFATGWKASHPYFDDALVGQLGLPVDGSQADVVDAKRFRLLEEEAEAGVLQRFPLLEEQPAHHKSRLTMTPFRLYNAIVPTHDQSIVFLGKTMLGNHFRNAEVQSLFAVAVLDGSLKLPSVPAMELEISRVVAWCRRRYLSKGQLGAWFYFDMVPYTDRLLAELGLRSDRKHGWRDLLEPCFAKDLKGLVDEYKIKYGAAI